MPVKGYAALQHGLNISAGAGKVKKKNCAVQHKRRVSATTSFAPSFAPLPEENGRANLGFGGVKV